MAVKIRLTRTGKRHRPSYRIIATNSRQARDAKAIEIIGHYNPSLKEPTFALDKERYEYWLSVGAQPTEAVAKLVDGTYTYTQYNPNAEEEEEIAVDEASEAGTDEKTEAEPAEEEKPEAEDTSNSESESEAPEKTEENAEAEETKAEE